MKNINIFKNTRKSSDAQPDYKMSISIQNQDGSYNNKEVGACWLKDMKDGGKYFSCKLKDQNEYEGKVYNGFDLVEEKPKKAEAPTVEYPADEIDPSCVPF